MREFQSIHHYFLELFALLLPRYDLRQIEVFAVGLHFILSDELDSVSFLTIDGGVQCSLFFYVVMSLAIDISSSYILDFGAVSGFENVAKTLFLLCSFRDCS